MSDNVSGLNTVKAERFHLVGIAGAGMSALAQALLDAGAVVTGSDRLADADDPCETITALKNQGVEIFRQNGEAVSSGLSGLVVSTAIEDDNPDVIRAGECGVSVYHRSHLIATLTRGKHLLAVTGTSGKSTVTAMVGHLLEDAGFNPSVINGASVIGWGGDSRCGSVSKGSGDFWVIEADESDRSLLHFSPEHLIITNASADHFSLSETNELFDRFKKGVPGVIIDGRLDDPTQVPECLSTPEGACFNLFGERFFLPVPGVHNALNAIQALNFCYTIGIPPKKMVKSLSGFKGVSRRLERIGTSCGTVIFDDMAHNPAKLRATWTALSEFYPRICAVWRPHGYGPLKNMYNDLLTMFSDVVRREDHLYILPVYDAGGSADRSIRSNTLVKDLQERDIPVENVSDIREAEERLRRLRGVASALVTLGARDPDLPRLARRLLTVFSKNPPKGKRSPPGNV